MTTLDSFLNQYHPQDAREEEMVSILQKGFKLQELSRDIELSDQQRRRLRFEFKKWRSHLLLNVFYQLPALSRPSQNIALQYRDDYESLLNEISAEFVTRILTEFQPEIVTQGKSLTSKLSIWINSKLRLKWRLLELITPQRKSREIKVLELILELAGRSPAGFTPAEFVTAIEAKNGIPSAWAMAFLDEILPQFATQLTESEQYLIDGDRLETYINQRQQQLYTVSLDRSVEANIPDEPPPPPADVPTFATKIAQLFTTHRQTLQSICVKNNPECHCFLLLENYFQEQFYQVKINEEEVTRLLGVKRPTYQSHLERRCLPKFWELAITTSPVSQPQPPHQEIPLKQYIETDPQSHLVRCYYVSRSGQEYTDCNSQNLAQQLLILFTPKPATWQNLAVFYQLGRDTLIRFWKIKCLFLLSWVTFELENELTDVVEVD